MTMEIEWLDDGAVYGLFPETACRSWMGSDSESYDDACDHHHGLCTKYTHAGHAVALVGEPGRMGVASMPTGYQLINWIHAPNDEAMTAFVAASPRAKDTVQSITIRSREPHWQLFNLTENLSADAATALPMLSLNLAPGWIEMRAAYCQEGDCAAYLFILRLVAQV